MVRRVLALTLIAAATAALAPSVAATAPTGDPARAVGVSTSAVEAGRGAAAAPRRPRVRLKRLRNGLLTAGPRRVRGERIRLRTSRRPPRRTRAQRAFLRRKFSAVNPVAAASPADVVPPPADAPLAEAPTSTVGGLVARSTARPHSHDGFVELRDSRVILGTQSGTVATNIVAEPSIANDRHAILAVGNHFAALSDDNGLNFRYLDPFATFKPPGDTTTPGGFCGDQVALAEDLGPRSLIFWVLQGCDNGSENAVRLVVFRSASELIANAGSTTNVCSYVFRPRDFGLKDNRGLDFPQLATTDRFLYITINEVKIRSKGDKNKNAVVWRMELDDLDSVACDADIDRSWVEPTKKTLAPVQGAGSTMYFATHHWELLPGKMLRIYKVADSSATLSRVDENITNFPKFSKSRSCPLTVGGGGDPCVRFDARIPTGFRSGNVVGWLWTSAQGDGYPYPHVRTATFTTPGLDLLTETQIWNPEYAWVHPAATVNARGEIGVVLYRMGGAQLPEARAFTISSPGLPLLPAHTNSLRVSANGVAEDQWGDFTTVRPHGNCANSFLTPVQSMTNGRTDADVEVRAIVFGRDGDGCADLAVTEAPWETVSASGAPSGLIRPRETLRITPVTQNQGTEAVTRQSRTAVYLSTDKELDYSDILLKPTHFIGSLDPTATAEATLETTIPFGTPLGAYYVLSCADHKAKVTEITDTNNCRASRSAALQVIVGGPLSVTGARTNVDFSALSTLQRTSSPNAQITARVTLRGSNVDAARLASTRVRYLLTPDARSDEEISLRVLRQSAAPTGPAGAPRRALTTRLRLPRRLGRGQWYLRTCLTHPRRAVDQRRSDDCRTATRPIRIR